MSYTSTTDYWEARRLERAARERALSIGLIRELARQRADNGLEAELETRRRIISGVTRASASSVGVIDFRPHARPRFVLQLGYTARREIKDEIHQSYWDFDGQRLETGGLLLGMYPPRPDSAMVDYATRPAARSRHSRHSVTIGRAADIFAELPETVQRADMHWLGDWHLHIGRGAVTPSDTDLRNWRTRPTRTRISA